MKCFLCKDNFDSLANSYLCVECKKTASPKQDRMAYARFYRSKTSIEEKLCKACAKPFKLESCKPAALYCPECAPAVREQTHRRSVDNHQVRRGRAIGVGSGNNQGIGEGHHSWKTGIGAYRRLGKSLGDHCQDCNKVIDRTHKYSWVIHHEDRDRSNNNIENLKLLCKSCHQKEHWPERRHRIKV